MGYLQCIEIYQDGAPTLFFKIAKQSMGEMIYANRMETGGGGEYL